MSFPARSFENTVLAKDGNCLFRAFVVFLNDKLLNGRRTTSGFPTNNKYKEYENHCVEFMRKTAVRYIDNFKHNYENSLFFDNELYDSIDDRISKMSNDGEFAGKLEIDILAKMYKLVICIFVYLEDEHEYSCVYRTDTIDDISIDKAELESKNYGSDKFCFLSLSNQHYSLLKPTEHFIDENLVCSYTQSPTSLRDIIDSPSGISDTPSVKSINSYDSTYSNYEEVSHNDIGNLSQCDTNLCHDSDKLYKRFVSLLEGKNHGLIVNGKTPKLLDIQPSMLGTTIKDLLTFIDHVNVNYK